MFERVNDPRAAAPAAPPVFAVVREVLDFFERCARCGYPAQATEVVRTYADGRVEIVLQPTCGQPCGWHGRPRLSHSSIDHLGELRNRLPGNESPY